MGNDDDYIFSVSTDHTYSVSISDIATTTIDTNNITTSTITTGIDDWISTDDLSITLTEPVEFEDHMPSLDKIKDMCQHYPGLKKAFKNFESVYKMVHQDYKGNHEPKIEVPF